MARERDYTCSPSLQLSQWSHISTMYHNIQRSALPEGQLQGASKLLQQNVSWTGQQLAAAVQPSPCLCSARQLCQLLGKSQRRLSSQATMRAARRRMSAWATARAPAANTSTAEKLRPAGHVTSPPHGVRCVPGSVTVVVPGSAHGRQCQYRALAGVRCMLSRVMVK